MLSVDCGSRHSLEESIVRHLHLKRLPTDKVLLVVTGPIHRQELVDKLPKGVQVDETDIVPYQTTPAY
jgi:uroporphyrinogen-III synthase